MASIWDQVGFLFDTDDCALHEIWVTGLSREGVAAAYAFLCSRSRTYRGATFWHAALDREERLDAWPDAALLVADGQAESFIFLACGLAFHGVVIPDLGVFVLPDEVRLDYRMGPEWNERRVLALFELLRNLAVLSPNARVTLHDLESPEVERRFQAVFSTFCRGQSPIPAPALNPQGPGRMTELQWQESADPDAMLRALGARACPRRLRLYSTACCRRVWHLVQEEALRQAVEAAERFADGEATSEELEAVWQATFRQEGDDGPSDDPLANARLWAASAASQAACDLDRAAGVASAAAWAASWASGLPTDTTFDRERAVQCDLLRCVFGNPFQAVRLEPAWRTPTVLALAQSAYDNRISPAGTLDAARLSVLADALEEVGCGDEAILNHCRRPGEHVRGCWVVDRLLARK